MKIEVTKDVAKHQINNNYDCLLIHFEKTDRHFFWDLRNWMPKDDEMFKIFRILFNLSPTFKQKVKEYIKEMEVVK